MEFITNPFGDSVPPAMKLVLLTLLLVVILLIVVWVIRKFVGSPAIKAARGRLPRLAVTDAANLDDKRRLVLVRRDNVEHLVMIGGTTDVLIEANIVHNKAVQVQSEQAGQSPLSSVAPTPAAAVSMATATTVAAISASTPTGSDDEITESTNENLPDTDQNIEPSSEVEKQISIDEPAESEISISSEEINPDNLSRLGDALGEELAHSSDMPVDEVSEPEPFAISDGAWREEITDNPSAEEIPEITIGEVIPEIIPENSPEMGDEMQKLLDELANEKA